MVKHCTPTVNQLFKKLEFEINIEQAKKLSPKVIQTVMINDAKRQIIKNNPSNINNNNNEDDHDRLRRFCW